MSNKKIITLDNLETYTEKVEQTYAKKTELFSKDYNELTNKPTIPDISGKADKSELENLADKNYVDNKIADLVNSAPEALNTLGELATALNEHEDAYDALLQTVGEKLDEEGVLATIKESAIPAIEVGFMELMDLTLGELRDKIVAAAGWHGGCAIICKETQGFDKFGDFTGLVWLVTRLAQRDSEVTIYFLQLGVELMTIKFKGPESKYVGEAWDESSNDDIYVYHGLNIDGKVTTGDTSMQSGVIDSKDSFSVRLDDTYTCEFPKQSGELLVRDEEGCVTVYSDEDEDYYLRLAVNDTGIGGFPYLELNRGSNDYTQYCTGWVSRCVDNTCYDISFPEKTGTVALTSDIANKQDKLSAGANVTIKNNIISAKDTIVEFEKVEELPELTPELAKEKEHTVYSHNGSLHNILYNVGGYQEPLYLKDTYPILPNPTNGGGCALVGNYIYIFGGYSYDENGEGFTDCTIRKFDIINKTVTTLDVELPELSGSGFEDKPVVAYGTDIYIFVSANIDGSHADVYKFDTITDTFIPIQIQATSDASSILGVNTATLGPNNNIYIVGARGEIYEYDIANESLHNFTSSYGIKIDNDNFVDSGGCLVKSVGDYIYFFGGYERNSISYFNPKSGEVTVLSTTFPEPIYDMSGVVFGTDIYLMGGEYNNKMYKFDTLTDTLTELDITLPTDHNKDGCAIAINDHEFFLIGGDIGGDEKTNNIYHYSLTEDTEGAILEYQQLTSGDSRPLKVQVPAGTTEQHLEPNKYYIFQSQVAPEITLTFAEEDEVYLDEFMGEIQVDEESITLNMPKNIVWREADGVTETETGISLEEKHMYIFSIMHNIGLISCIKNPVLDSPVATITEDNKLIWEPIDGADYYEVAETTMLGGAGTLLVRTEDTSVDLTLVDEFNKTEVFYLCVWACSKKYTDSYSSTYSYKGTGTLEAPINLILNDNNQLSWDPINFETSSSLSTGYIVELVETGSSTIVTTNLCNLSTSFTELTTPGTYTFIVRSRVNDIINTNIVWTSAPSESVTVTIQ